jgi:UDP-N-acetylmuramate dehydrogenase
MEALRDLTTLRVGGTPEGYFSISDTKSLLEAREFLRSQHKPYAILGGGSNVLAADLVPGYILRVSIPGISYDMSREGTVLARVGAGVSWDSFVEDSVARGLWGVENLSGIPGTTGATPIQNVGAYGREVRDQIVSVEAVDMASGEVRVFSNAECQFEYRSSRFAKGGEPLCITKVTFRLSEVPGPELTYPDLQRMFADDSSPTPARVRDAILSIRSKKFPSLAEVGTAGSFFKNPILSESVFEGIRNQFPGIPGIRLRENAVKVPLAFILDRLGFRGRRAGVVGLHEKQPIVLVHFGGGTAYDIDSFASSVERDVLHATRLRIEREVKFFPKFLHL